MGLCGNRVKVSDLQYSVQIAFTEPTLGTFINSLCEREPAFGALKGGQLAPNTCPYPPLRHPPPRGLASALLQPGSLGTISWLPALL